MAQLAIKGHTTRGKEVIEILEMLGGKTSKVLNGDLIFYGYYINSKNGFIDYKHRSDFNFNNDIIYSLEEFLEKFPYKVGDKIKVCGDNLGVIISMRWEIEYVVYKVKLSKNGYETNKTSDNLQPYKEETMEDRPNLLQQLKEYFDNTPREVVEKEWNELSYLNEIGPSIDEYLEYVKKYRQSNQYPKTYEECCKVLNLTKYPPALVPNKATYINQYKDFPCYYEIQKLAELIVCRNAYWKIAGDQMGLGKPWEPDSKNIVHYIYYSMYDNEIQVSCGNLFDNEILTFPTAEMRDTFYKNFKSSIEDCKELL